MRLRRSTRRRPLPRRLDSGVGFGQVGLAEGQPLGWVAAAVLPVQNRVQVKITQVQPLGRRIVLQQLFEPVALVGRQQRVAGVGGQLSQFVFPRLGSIHGCPSQLSLRLTQSSRIPRIRWTIL